MKPLPLIAAILASLAAPPARADGLTMRVVDEVVEKSDRAIQACGRGLDIKRGDVVAVMVLLTIDAEGHVADAFAADRSRAATCIEKVARRLTFPSPGETVQMHFPFLLHR